MRHARSLAALLLIATIVPSALAGSPRSRRSRLVPAQYAAKPVDPSLAPSPYLGTFYPTSYATVRGNNPIGGGYSPNGLYGTSNLSIYGPMSLYRQVEAPVLTYQRGFDGMVRPTVATSFSNPNLPTFNPVTYPTRGSLYYAPRTQRTPPSLDNGYTFIDQN